MMKNKRPTYTIDDCDFYKGCLVGQPDPAEGIDYVLINAGLGWGGPKDEATEAARLAGLRRTWVENPQRREAQAERMREGRRSGRIAACTTPEAIAARQQRAYALGKSLSKPCTVDGTTIYASRRALIDALGAGKAGSKHPNFRFVTLKDFV